MKWSSWESPGTYYPRSISDFSPMSRDVHSHVEDQAAPPAGPISSPSCCSGDLPYLIRLLWRGARSPPLGGKRPCPVAWTIRTTTGCSGSFTHVKLGGSSPSVAPRNGWNSTTWLNRRLLGRQREQPHSPAPVARFAARPSPRFVAASRGLASRADHRHRRSAARPTSWETVTSSRP